MKEVMQHFIFACRNIKIKPGHLKLVDMEIQDLLILRLLWS